ncbi:TPA: acyltransferase, partial [Escherichia coli]|nr:acyltransferase [Escherichia coli]
PLFGTGSGLDYIFSLGALQSFIDYSTLGWHPNNINGFASNYIHKGMLNGSLWTLSFEFAAYIFVSIAFFRKKNVTMCALIVITISIIAQLSVLNGIKIPHTGDLNRLSLLTVTFFCGSLLYCLRKYWESTQSKITLMVLAILCALFISEKNEYDLTFYIAVPFFIIPLCTLFKDKIINGKFDISYGMYIYAYPVQQIVVNNTNLGFFGSMLLSLIIVVLLASLSWVFIERKFLNESRSVAIIKESA